MTVTTATRLRIVPETPALGAVVEGVNAKEPLGADVVAALREALLTYKVLFFRGLHLSREEHHAFATAFGEPCVNRSRFLRNYDEDAMTNVTVTPHFHADLMYMPEGPSFSMLQMLELPRVGGDTMWADLVASYADLSEPFRAFLETLTVMQASDAYYLSDEDLKAHMNRRRDEKLTDAQVAELREHLAPWEAPLVRVIPETGAKNAWVAPPCTRSIKGLSKAESDAILGVLFAHQLQPKYVYRWRWGVGDIAFWDHRTTLHSGIADFGDERRFGNRVSVARNAPLPVGA